MSEYQKYQNVVQNQEQKTGVIPLEQLLGRGAIKSKGVILNAMPPLDQLLNSNRRGVNEMLDGNKPVVVCGGVVTEAKSMDDAQRIAEAQAHSKGADAYILKPVKRVAPKREVVTTELE